MTVRRPIEHGIITNWDDMESLLHHTFYDALRVTPEEHKVLLSEPPPGPKANREKLIQLMFETFSVPGTCLAQAAVLALYASGATTGLVLECGDGITHSVPIYEGYSLPHAILRLELAGSSLTQHAARLLVKQGVPLARCRDVKEKLCFVAPSAIPAPASGERWPLLPDEEEVAPFQAQLPVAEPDFLRLLPRDLRLVVSRFISASAPPCLPYRLPDGRLLFIDQDRYVIPEPLFRPSLLGLESAGVSELLFSSAMKCDVAIRNDLLGHVVLSGGSTMFAGFEARVRKELADLMPAPTRLEVIAPRERRFSAWVGGSILASLSTFPGLWITQAEYEESGPAIVHMKCF